MYTIYKITCGESGKSYFGKTKQPLRKRWISHIADATRGEDTHFKRAIRKYGRSAFALEEIAWASDNEKANWLETYFIRFNDSVASGYNSTYGGDGQSNPTEETLQKMRKGFTGKHTPEAIAKIKAARAKQVMTPERNSAVSRGKKRFEELKRAAFVEKKPAAHQTTF